jgi:hypothetical protein
MIQRLETLFITAIQARKEQRNMIEVRTSYLVRMKDVGKARALLQELRERVWPVLGRQGRLQEMLHGHVQQSLFVWSSQWENLAAWETDMNRLLSCEEYLEWLGEWNKLLVYGEEREVFRLIEPIVPLDNAPGKVEVRSSYAVPLKNAAQALALAEEDQRMSWELKEAAQDQVMLLGKAAESTFTFATMSDSLTAYEQELSSLGGRGDFFAWWEAWTEAVGFGGSREILRNL